MKRRIIRRQEVIVVVECFKCEEREHKYRECLLWKKKKRKVKGERAMLCYTNV